MLNGLVAVVMGSLFAYLHANGIFMIGAFKLWFGIAELGVFVLYLGLFSLIWAK